MAWLTLPDLIFSDIMMIVGLESLESLHRCRQVCSKWNEKILRNIWESQSKKRIMKERIEKNWGPGMFPSYEKNWGPGMFPSDEEISHAKWLEARGILTTEKIERFTAKVRDVITGSFLRDVMKNRYLISGIEGQRVLMCATSLAHHGLLSSTRMMTLLDVDLSPVPTQHLASLASCVTKGLLIENVSGCDLVSLYTSLKCTKLFITRQSLGREETQALVQAMESGVKEVRLRAGVTLDMKALAEYSGQGVCREVWLYYKTAARYR